MIDTKDSPLTARLRILLEKSEAGELSSKEMWAQVWALLAQEYTPEELDYIMARAKEYYERKPS